MNITTLQPFCVWSLNRYHSIEMNCALSTIIIVLLAVRSDCSVAVPRIRSISIFSQVYLVECEPPGFAVYMGVDFQDGGFGKYVFMEMKLRKTSPRRPTTSKLYTCRSSGMFPDPIDPGSYYKCTFSLWVSISAFFKCVFLICYIYFLSRKFFFSSDGYTYSRYFCPPFYTFSEDSKSCVIYYEELSSANVANETKAEKPSAGNITDFGEQTVEVL